MANEPASARQTGKHTHVARKVKRRSKNMLCDLERVRAALRTGARPQQIHGKNSLTKRSLKPDTIAHGPDGDVLILARWGRVTLLGRMWDEECAERARSPRVEMGPNKISGYYKGAITATETDAPNCGPHVVPSAAQ